MHRFYVNPENIHANTLYITNGQVHHLKDVMRVKQGNKIIALDGKGKEYTGIVTSISSGQIEVKISKIKQMKEKKYHIHLVQSIPKKDVMDSIIQKATELGVDEITPIISAHTIVKIKDDTKKIERWNRIVIESVKQCNRMDTPLINPIKSFKQVLDTLQEDTLCIIASTSGKRQLVKQALHNNTHNNITILIGPEGDFTPEEVETAIDKGCVPVSLGDIVLRCDTAAMLLIGLVSHELG